MQADRKLYIMACLTVIPEFSSTAKSPSSWGNSSQRTARDTDIPVRMDSEKAAPIESPSMKL